MSSCSCRLPEVHAYAYVCVKSRCLHKCLRRHFAEEEADSSPDSGTESDTESGASEAVACADTDGSDETKPPAGVAAKCRAAII